MKRHICVPDPEWSDRPVAIVASGPSVSGELQTRLLEAHDGRSIAVKDGFVAYPRADLLIIGDHRHARRNPDYSQYLGNLIIYTDPDKPCPPTMFDKRMEFMPKVAGRGFSTDPSQLQGTFSTTCLAINYAFLKGATEIHLYGVDGHAGPNNQRHFVGGFIEHWPERYNKQKWGYSRLLDDIKKYKIRVFNMNPVSSVAVFPKYGEPQWNRIHSR